jgi:CheY-like chemotaxis protein
MSLSTRILLVEDNTFDAKVFQRAIREARLENPIVVARNGAEALTVLSDYAGIDDPDLLIVTDLNMPRVNGIDLLRKIRSDAAFAHLPVFVVTTSDAPADRERAVELGIEGYICKTGDGADLIEPIIAYLAGQVRCKR